MDIEIATYWNVMTLFYVLNGVASIMAGAGFEGLLKMVFYFAIAIGIFAYAGNRQLEMGKWFIQALIFTSILNMPIARVAITDRTGIEPPRVVDNVPFTLAVVAQTANIGFGWATRTYETVFGVPDELGLQQGDLAFGHRILRNVNKVVVRDPGLRADVMQFIKECTLYDIRDGVLTPNQVIGQTDTWNTIFSNTSPARFATYNTLTATPTTDTCNNVAGILRARVDAGIDAAETFYGRQNFSRIGADETARSMFAAAIGSSYDWILASSATASNAMKQAMFNNIWRDAGAELPALMSDPARIQELQNMAGAAQAARQTDGSNATLSMLAQETLPHMRNWLEAIVFAMFPLVVVMVVVVSAEGAKRIVAGYMMSLAWIGMWPVLFAVINHLSMMHLRSKMAALDLAEGVPFQLSDTFDATLGNELAAIGVLVCFVPFISAALIKLGQGGFMSVADKMMSGFSSAATSSGSSLAGGNVSIGQAGMDTAAVNTTTMHKHDSNIALAGGGASVGYGSGNVARMAANGAVALQQFQNRLLTSMGIDHRWQSERAQEGHQTSITSSGRQEAFRHGDATTLTDVRGTESSRGAFQHTSENASIARAGHESGSHSTGQGLHRQSGERSSFSQAAGMSSAGFMGLSVGGGSGQGQAGVGADPTKPTGPNGGRASPSSSAGEGRIVRGMRDGGAGPIEINAAVDAHRAGSGVGSHRTVTDDFGNQVRVPTGRPQTASSVAPTHERPRGRSALVGSLGFQSQKTYDARHSQDKTVDQSYTVDERAQLENGFSITGQQGVSSSTGMQSAQNNRSGQDAALTRVDERSSIQDVSDRREFGVGDRVSRSSSNSFAVHHDLISDPNLLERVAARNGMSATRFMGQEEGRMLQMVSDYVAERGAMTAPTTMPVNGLSGGRVPTTRGELRDHSDSEQGILPSDIRRRHARNAAGTGFMGVTPITPNTSTPSIVSESEAHVRSQLDRSAVGSIPQRSDPLQENVSAWASPDKEVGAGRANPAAVVETMVGRDVKDTVLKVVDKLKGGDGTADGERLNENMTRDNGTRLEIRQPSRKE